MVVVYTPTQLIAGKFDSGYTIREMDVQVYADGVTSLDYVFDVDINRARINISLPGAIYEDMLVTDDEGFQLDYEVCNNSLKIDVLGSEMVEVSYTTTSLTNKTAATWSFSLMLPIEASIRLPPEATIMGMTPTPTSITMAGDRITLTMPRGEITLIYLVGVTGTREHAITLINDADDYIEKVKNLGIITDEAEEILQLAEDEYTEGNYVEAEEYAKSAKEKAQQIEGLAAGSQIAIEEAESAIKEAQTSGRTSQLDQAKSALVKAETLYSEGNYQEAKVQAEESERIAINSEEEGTYSSINISWMIAAGASLTVIALIYWSMIREKISKGVDLDGLFEENPHLREDEREVISYLADKPDGLFASDIRERLDIPRSTAWRMIQRLEEDGIIEKNMVGRETHINIADRYRYD